MNKLVLNKAFLCLQPRTHNVGSLQDSCCSAHAMSLTLPPQRARRSIINGGSLILLCSCFTSRVHSASAQKAVSIHCSIKNITLATCQDVLLDDCHSRRSAFLPREGLCPASSVNAPCGAFCFLATPPCNFVAMVFVHLPKQPPPSPSDEHYLETAALPRQALTGANRARSGCSLQASLLYIATCTRFQLCR